MGAGKFWKRLAWRWQNLTLEDFVNSYKPVLVRLPKLDSERYKRYELDYDNIKLHTNYSPFVVIKPSGVEFEDKIKTLLLEKGVIIEEEKPIDDYIRFGLRLYRRPYHTAEDIMNSHIWFALDEYLYPDKLNRAKCLFLNKNSVDFDNLRNFKKEVRLKIGHIRFYRVACSHLQDEAFSSFIHVPDKEDMQREYSIARDY